MTFFNQNCDSYCGCLEIGTAVSIPVYIKQDHSIYICIYVARDIRIPVSVFDTVLEIQRF